MKEYRVALGFSPVGPKQREGDGRTPEGNYKIDFHKSDSAFHRALHISYPDAADTGRAAEAGVAPGGDIMIHGSSVSVGCLAMGDEAAEDLFVLAADTGLTNIQAILSPVDFRAGKTVPESGQAPPWRASLYAAIKTSLSDLKE